MVPHHGLAAPAGTGASCAFCCLMLCSRLRIIRLSLFAFASCSRSWCQAVHWRQLYLTALPNAQVQQTSNLDAANAGTLRQNLNPVCCFAGQGQVRRQAASRAIGCRRAANPETGPAAKEELSQQAMIFRTIHSTGQGQVWRQAADGAAGRGGAALWARRRQHEGHARCCHGPMAVRADGLPGAALAALEETHHGYW